MLRHGVSGERMLRSSVSPGIFGRLQRQNTFPMKTLPGLTKRAQVVSRSLGGTRLLRAVAGSETLRSTTCQRSPGWQPHAQPARGVATSVDPDVSDAPLESTGYSAAGCNVRYSELIAAGKLSADSAQKAAIDQLSALHSHIKAESKGQEASKVDDSSSDGGSVSSWWSALFGGADESRSAAESNGPRRALYIWGGVGCGKTMVMDLFYDSVSEVPKRRVHFHSFMLEV
eukprot:SAG31_NODE_10359_length_1149_cov_0.836190_1_plen_228_part_10